jgi:acylpyruvate hydrolase
MIGNIYCVGRNYVAHAAELGNSVEAEPVIFSKPVTSVCTGNVIQLPEFSNSVHFETELVVKISQKCFKIDEKHAVDCFDSYALGLDLTARDLQNRLKEKRLPWFLAKGFKDSAYLTEFFPKADLPEPLHFEMELNGETKQVGNTENMIFKIPEIIAFLSQYIPLYPDDVIFTGTPAGVAALTSGDRISLYLAGRAISEVIVV